MQLPPNVKFNNIKELITWGYVNGPSGSGFVKTYFDKACTKQQCHSARRSFEDLLDICRTYFPRTGKKQLALTLHSLFTQQLGTMNVMAFYCSNIHKVVFFKYRLPAEPRSWETAHTLKYTNYFDRSLYSGATPPQKKGVGKYCFNEILNLLNKPLIPEWNNPV